MSGVVQTSPRHRMTFGRVADRGWHSHLAQVESHLAQGDRLVTGQNEIVQRHASDGYDPLSPEKLLALFVAKRDENSAVAV